MPSTEKAAKELEAFEKAAAELNRRARESGVFRKALLQRIAPYGSIFKERRHLALEVKNNRGETLSRFQQSFLRRMQARR